MKLLTLVQVLHPKLSSVPGGAGAELPKAGLGGRTESCPLSPNESTPALEENSEQCGDTAPRDTSSHLLSSSLLRPVPDSAVTHRQRQELQPPRAPVTQPSPLFSFTSFQFRFSQPGFADHCACPKKKKKKGWMDKQQHLNIKIFPFKF